MLLTFIAFAIVCTALTMESQAALDQNGNRISDIWEQMYPGLDPFLDSDLDGFTNAEEAIAGTDPTNASSFFQINEFEKVSEGVVFRWEGVAGKAYEIERFDTSSGVWMSLSTGGAVSAGLQERIIEHSEQKGLFRLRVVDVDEDGDGLTAWEEALLRYSDASGMSSGNLGRADFSSGLRALEGAGTLELAGGILISKRVPERGEVVRFLAQASFGADPELIDHVMAVGIGGWLDEQLNPTVLTTTYQSMLGQYASSGFPSWWGMGWWKSAMTGPDQLRLRIAYALSQILVVSNAGSDNLRGNSNLQADYYDILLQHSLGSYRDLLEDVTYSAQMGLYLSHLQNRKSDPSTGRFPDENFAREIMQLFSIGLWRLNPDGSRVLDWEGNPISTYDNETVMEMAKIFTGFGLGGPNTTSFFSSAKGNDYVYPMKMWEEEHEQGEKRIVNGVIVPEGQTGEEDVDDALDALCNHPNIAPFVSRLLIQRLVCSNPSPAYISRVAAAWAEDGSGERGNLKAVMEALLLDPEARTPSANGDASGKVREPFLRMVALLRAFKARNQRSPATFPVWPGFYVDDMGQMPLWAPSVFNFYLPDHRPAGELRQRELASPELAIATSDRLIKTDNRLRGIIDSGVVPYGSNALDYMKCDFSEALALASNMDDVPLLVDYLDELLCWGSLSANTKQAVVVATQAQGHPSLTAAQNAELRVKAAVHLIIESPDFVVLK